MIDRSHAFPIKGQARMLGLSRSTVYYKPRPVSAEDLQLMRPLDELHLDYPFAGARMLRDLLRREGVGGGRRHRGFVYLAAVVDWRAGACRRIACRSRWRRSFALKL